MPHVNKKIAALIIIVVLTPTVPLINGGGGAFASDDSFSCDLKTEAPVGELADSIIELNARLLEQVKIISDQARIASNNARNLVKAKDTCDPKRCDSTCKTDTIFSACNTDCKPGYTCNFVDTGIFNNDYPLGSWLLGVVLDCKTLSNFNPDDEARYAEFKYKRTGSKDLWKKCYNLACDTQICEAEECQGDACDFNKISQLTNAISSAKDLIDTAYDKITDFFELVVQDLPLFGEPCFPPFMKSYSGCKTCNIVSAPPYNLNTCSEVGYLFKITSITADNLSGCETGGDLNDLGEGSSMESLWRCQDIKQTISGCYDDNFFCCLLK